MKQEKAHGDFFYYPPDDNSQHDPTQVEQKDATYVQGRRGVLDYPYDAAEYYAKQSYDFLDEQRDQADASGANTVIDFGRQIKSIWIFVPSGSSSPLFVNFGGFPAANANGSIQVLAGEGRQFFISVRQINVASDGANAADFRITWGY